MTDEKIAEIYQEALNHAAEHIRQRGYRPITGDRITAKGVAILIEEIKNLKPKGNLLC